MTKKQVEPVLNKSKKNKYLFKFKKIFFSHTKKTFDINLLTSNLIAEELKRETYKSRYLKVLKSTIYILIIIAALAVLVATFFMPVFQISETSMSPKFNNGDFILSVKINKMQSGDVIAFYHGNKILVKRVIASSGEWVTMDEEGNVYVNGLKLEESYLSNKSLGDYDIEFPYQVTDGSWFVLSDNRSNSEDSRNTEIGCIKEENIIGKIVFRIWPLNNFGTIK